MPVCFTTLVACFVLRFGLSKFHASSKSGECWWNYI